MIHLHKDKSKAIVCPKQGHLYPVAARQIEALSTEVCHNHNQDNVSSTYLWHCRLGHIHIQALRECQKQKSVRGMPTISFKTIKVCEGCLYGKMSHKSLSPSSTNTTEPLQLVHSDLCGPFSSIYVWCKIFHCLHRQRYKIHNSQFLEASGTSIFSLFSLFSI